MTAEPETAALLAPYLDQDERLVWTGRPRIGIRLRAVDLAVTPFSLLFTGLALVYEYAAIRVGAPIATHAWGTLFVLAGLYLLAGRFFWDAFRREWTFYGVTTRHALFASGAWRRRVRRVPLQAVRGVTIREHADGTGDVVLDGHAWTFGWFGIGVPGLGLALPLTFEAVPEPRLAWTAVHQGLPGAADGQAGSV